MRRRPGLELDRHARAHARSFARTSQDSCAALAAVRRSADNGGNVAKPLSQPGFRGANDDLEERLKGVEIKDLETIDID